LYFFAALTAVVILGVVALSAVRDIDWSVFTIEVVQLVAVLGFLYWTTTLLPGPVKRLGRSVGRKGGRFRR